MQRPRPRRRPPPPLLAEAEEAVEAGAEQHSPQPAAPLPALITHPPRNGRQLPRAARARAELRGGVATEWVLSADGSLQASPARGGVAVVRCSEVAPRARAREAAAAVAGEAAAAVAAAAAAEVLAAAVAPPSGVPTNRTPEQQRRERLQQLKSALDGGLVETGAHSSAALALSIPSRRVAGPVVAPSPSPCAALAVALLRRVELSGDSMHRGGLVSSGVGSLSLTYLQVALLERWHLSEYGKLASGPASAALTSGIRMARACEGKIFERSGTGSICDGVDGIAGAVAAQVIFAFNRGDRKDMHKAARRLDVLVSDAHARVNDLPELARFISAACWVASACPAGTLAPTSERLLVELAERVQGAADEDLEGLALADLCQLTLTLLSLRALPFTRTAVRDDELLRCAILIASVCGANGFASPDVSDCCAYTLCRVAEAFASHKTAFAQLAGRLVGSPDGGSPTSRGFACLALCRCMRTKVWRCRLEAVALAGGRAARPQQDPIGALASVRLLVAAAVEGAATPMLELEAAVFM